MVGEEKRLECKLQKGKVWQTSTYSGEQSQGAEVWDWGLGMRPRTIRVWE